MVACFDLDYVHAPERSGRVIYDDRNILIQFHNNRGNISATHQSEGLRPFTTTQSLASLATFEQANYNS